MDEREAAAFIEQEDVQFIRLTFFDLFGHQKNVSIMPTELERARQTGIPINPRGLSGGKWHTVSEAQSVFIKYFALALQQRTCDAYVR